MRVIVELEDSTQTIEAETLDEVISIAKSDYENWHKRDIYIVNNYDEKEDIVLWYSRNDAKCFNVVLDAGDAYPTLAKGLYEAIDLVKEQHEDWNESGISITEWHPEGDGVVLWNSLEEVKK